MWSAAVVYNSGMDSFEDDISLADSKGIVTYTQKLAIAMLNGRPLMNSLPEIIKYVTSKQPTIK